jgi:NDP-sugar pyrophosphorylase family protein
LPVGNLPLINRIVLNLRAQDIKEFVFLLHYQPEQFIQTLGDGSRFDAEFRYVIMEKDLSTAGSVKCAREHITETALIIPPTFSPIAAAPMLWFHQRHRAITTLALHRCLCPCLMGSCSATAREDSAFFENPLAASFSDWINAAIYLIEPSCSSTFRFGPVLSRKSFRRCRRQSADFRFPLSGYWRDVARRKICAWPIDYLHGKFSTLMLTPEAPALTNLHHRWPII